MVHIIQRIRALLSCKTVKQKIMYGMLFITFTMILSYMVISIFYSYQMMLESSIKTSAKELEFAANNVDNLLSIVDNYSVILATDEVIQTALSASSNADLVSVNEITIRNQINNIIGTFRRINAVLITDTQGNIYDSGVSVIPSETVLEELSQDTGWKSTAPAPYYISVPGQYMQPNVISFTRTISNYSTGALLGHITIFVDESYVRSAYLPGDGIDHVMYLQSYDGSIISGTEPLYETGRFNLSDLDTSSGFQRMEDEYLIYLDYPTLRCYFVAQIQRSEIETTIDEMQFFMIAIGVVLLFATVLLALMISRKLTINLCALADAMKEMQQGNWNIQLASYSCDEIGILADNFNTMVNEIRSKTDRLVSEQRMKRKYQLELLNQQINPHFLYNTLDNICALAELGQAEDVVSLVNNMSTFYRGVLSKGSLIIPLRQELEIARSYLNIMQTRFHYTFHYSIEIPEEFMENSILRLTLQPILENAIAHGFESHEPGGVIQVSARTIKDHLQLIVRDNGQGMSPETVGKLFHPEESTPHSGGFALKNVYDRIQLYYGSAYGIAVQSQPGLGTKVIIQIPHRSWKEDQHA